jgi:hypothetical protein
MFYSLLQTGFYATALYFAYQTKLLHVVLAFWGFIILFIAHVVEVVAGLF